MNTTFHAIRIKYNVSAEPYENFDKFYNPITQYHTENQIVLSKKIYQEHIKHYNKKIGYIILELRHMDENWKRGIIHMDDDKYSWIESYSISDFFNEYTLTDLIEKLEIIPPKLLISILDYFEDHLVNCDNIYGSVDSSYIDFQALSKFIFLSIEKIASNNRYSYNTRSFKLPTDSVSEEIPDLIYSTLVANDLFNSCEYGTIFDYLFDFLINNKTRTKLINELTEKQLNDIQTTLTSNITKLPKSYQIKLLDTIFVRDEVSLKLL